MTDQDHSAMIRVYHVTTEPVAEAIQASGFRDGTGTYMTSDVWTGVWLSDRALD